MQNNFGTFQAGTVSFTDNSRTYNGVVIDAEEIAALRTRSGDVARQVDAAVARLEPELASSMRSVSDEVAAEVTEPAPDRGRLAKALARLTALAGGVAAAAGIVDSVESMMSVLGGT